MKRFALTVGGIALLAVVIAAATSAAQAAGPTFDKANFHHPLDITNRYMLLKPGTTFVYDGTEDGKPTQEEFAVTDQIKTILGVDTRVIRDTNWEAGRVVEITYDWFAQDDMGNVWYFGEFSTQYKNGKAIGHEGSWQAGVDGAKPGVVMKAHPKVGDTYQQELAPGIAEDMATVLSLTESVCVPYGCFSHVLKTKEFTPLEPGIAEHKYFAPGVGHVKTVMVEGGAEESYLVKIVTDDRDD